MENFKNIVAFITSIASSILILQFIGDKKQLKKAEKGLKKVAKLGLHPWFIKSFFAFCTLFTFLGLLQAMFIFDVIRDKGYSNMTAMLTCGVLIVLALNFFYQSVKFTDILSVQKSK